MQVLFTGEDTDLSRGLEHEIAKRDPRLEHVHQRGTGIPGWRSNASAQAAAFDDHICALDSYRFGVDTGQHTNLSAFHRKVVDGGLNRKIISPGVHAVADSKRAATSTIDERPKEPPAIVNGL